MKSGMKDFCGLFSATLAIMGAMASLAAVRTNSRELYIQAIVYGIAGALIALAAVLRM